MNISLFPNLTRENACGITEKICAVLDSLGIDYCMEQSMSAVFAHTRASFADEDTILRTCDLVLAVGGDGVDSVATATVDLTSVGGQPFVRQFTQPPLQALKPWGSQYHYLRTHSKGVGCFQGNSA